MHIAHLVNWVCRDVQVLIALCQQNMNGLIDPKLELAAYIRVLRDAQKSGDPNLVAYVVKLLDRFIDGVNITPIEPGTKVDES